MKKIILSLCLLSLAALTSAQMPAFDWAKSMGSTNNDEGHDIKVDGSGNVYTIGRFRGVADFDPGIGIDTVAPTGNCGYDVFVTKFDAAGNFLWVKTFGGCSGSGLFLDASSNIFITGFFLGSADFDPGSGIYNLVGDTIAGTFDAYILKLDSNGTFIWAKALYGLMTDWGSAITVDPSGNVYSTGTFADTADFDPGTGVFQLYISPYAHSSTYVSKLDSSGNFVWAKKFETLVDTVTGIGGDGIGQAIAVDNENNVYITGGFMGTVDFDPGPGIDTLTSTPDTYNPFICKLDASGNLVWVTGYTTSAVHTYGNGIVLDEFKNVYTTGAFAGTVDFDPGSGTFFMTGAIDTYVTKLTSSGNFVWAKSFQNGGINEAQAIDLDAFGNIYTAGAFQGTVDFDPGAGIYILPNLGSNDVFVSKLDPNGDFVWAVAFGGTTGYDFGYGIDVDDSLNVLTTGYFRDTVDCDPGAGVSNINSVTPFSSDIFVHKLSQPGAVGITENDFSKCPFIYPNPTSGLFNIIVQSRSENSSIEVYTSIGALVFKQKIVSELNTVKLTDLSNGLYLVKVISDEKTMGMQKIIKQ